MVAVNYFLWHIKFLLLAGRMCKYFDLMLFVYVKTSNCLLNEHHLGMFLCQSNETR